MRSFFYLRFNDLGGTLPSELGQLSRMREHFQAQNNRLNGTLPTEVIFAQSHICNHAPPPHTHRASRQMSRLTCERALLLYLLP